jgi:hypothetical protein
LKKVEEEKSLPKQTTKGEKIMIKAGDLAPVEVTDLLRDIFE